MAIVKHFNTERLTSLHLKSYLMSYWRYDRQKVAIDEYMSMDVAVFDKNYLIDCEIKISKQDLLADNKKDKHIYYKTGNDKYGHRHADKIIPTHFYFCVPSVLKESAIREALRINDKYGVIVIDGYYQHSIVKKASILHLNKIDSERILWEVAKRCSAKLQNMYQRQLQNQLDNEVEIERISSKEGK